MILKLHGTYHLLLKVHKGGPRLRSHQKLWSGWSSQCCHWVSYTVVDHLKLLWFMKWCVYCCIYLHFMPFKSFTWSLYRSKAMWRLTAESPAWSAAKTHVFSTELGWGTLQIWKDIWKILHPCLHLSSPRFHLGESCRHAMSACFSLKYIDVGSYLQKGIIAYIFYLSFCSRSWNTFSLRSGT